MQTQKADVPELRDEDGFRTNESPTVAGRVYALLRERILNMQLVPGTSMSEQEMASSLGVSRTPVREAFIRLSREKMVIVSPQRRTVVPKISFDRVKQEWFLRESLEYAALEQLVLSKTPDVIDRLLGVIEIQKEATQRGDCAAFLEYDDAYHKVFFTATDNHLCFQVLRRNVFDYQRLRYLSLCSEESIRLMNVKQHEKMVKLIAKGDLDQLQLLLRGHLRRIFKEFETLKGKFPDYIL